VLYFAGAIVRLLSIGEFGSVPFILVFLVSNLWMLISGMNLDLSGVSPKRILGKQNPIFDLPKSPVLGEALRQGSETKVPNPKVVPGAIGSLKAEVLPPTSADSISRAPVTPPVAGPVAETGLTGDSNNRGQFKQAPRSI